MTWSYEPTQLDGSTTYQVRLLIGDTEAGDPLLQDEELAFMIATAGGTYAGAAMAARAVAAKFSRDADSTQGELRVLYSSRSRAYAARAVELDELASFSGGAVASPYTGGVSVADKAGRVADLDRVRPSFNRGLTDHVPVVPNDVDPGTGG